MEKEDYHVREVYAHYGLAMYSAQSLEKAICILLTAETSDPKTMTKSDYDRILKSYFDKTFGVCIKKLNTTIEITPKLEERLQNALEKRNLLAHTYFWDRAAHFMREDGRNYMIRELNEITDFFEKLDSEISEINHKWLSKLGISEDWIEKQMEKIIKNLTIA